MVPRPRRLALALVTAAAVAACGGGGATPSGAGDPTGAPSDGAASPAGAASDAPTTNPGGGGSETIRVVLTGGPDAGTYTSTEDPQCTHGLIGEGGWGVQFSTDQTGDKDFTSLQVVYYENGPGDGAMFDASLLTTVTIGELFASGRTYEIELSEDPDEAKGEGTASVEDGDQPVISISGSTDDGVAIEATVNCPSVTRT